MPVAAVTGLAAEATIARRTGLRAVAGGGDAGRTAAAIRQLIGEGVTGLVSFGICGGLDPALTSGAVVLPRWIQSDDGTRHPVDAAWHAALAGVLQSAEIWPATGDLFGGSAVVDTAPRKAALFRRSGAVAVDLESHLVGEAAEAAGIPFIVLRTVADAAGRSLPPAVLVGLDANGRPALGRVLASILRQAGQIPALLRAAFDTRRALQALSHAAELGRANLCATPAAGA
jgi:adenosylhomocysteine nucleosidase